MGHVVRADDVTSPIGLSLVTVTEKFYLQYPGPKDDVFGLRLGLIRTVNENVTGIDLGLFHSVSTNYTGPLQIVAIDNLVKGKARVFGLQWGGIFNTNKEAQIVGFQLGFKNTIQEEGTVVGFQLGFWNHAPKTDVYGGQLFLVNHARKVVGFQLGLVNIADRLYGVQVGLLNFNRGGPLRFFPLVNAGF